MRSKKHLKIQVDLYIDIYYFRIIKLAELILLVKGTIWNQVIALYPCLVECTVSPCPQITNAVKDTLHHYFSLLKAP